MKKKCFKCFVLLLIVYKILCLVCTPQKIISNNNQKDMQIVHSYMVYQDNSVQKFKSLRQDVSMVSKLPWKTSIQRHTLS